MNTQHDIQLDPKVDYVRKLVNEIESTLCDQKQIPNPDHMLSDEVRNYLIHKELNNYYYHLKR